MPWNYKQNEYKADKKKAIALVKEKYPREAVINILISHTVPWMHWEPEPLIKNINESLLNKSYIAVIQDKVFEILESTNLKLEEFATEHLYQKYILKQQLSLQKMEAKQWKTSSWNKVVDR